MENDLKREDLIRRSDVIAKLKEENERGHLAPWVGKDVYSAVRRIPAVDVRENVIRTQGDKLRAMSDEELAQWIDDHEATAWCPDDVPVDPVTKDCLHREYCWQCVLDWLKSPVEGIK